MKFREGQQPGTVEWTRSKDLERQQDRRDERLLRTWQETQPHVRDYSFSEMLWGVWDRLVGRILDRCGIR